MNIYKLVKSDGTEVLIKAERAVRTISGCMQFINRSGSRNWLGRKKDRWETIASFEQGFWQSAQMIEGE